jgi:hypothetical protein
MHHRHPRPTPFDSRRQKPPLNDKRKRYADIIWLLWHWFGNDCDRGRGSIGEICETKLDPEEL